MPQLSWWRDSHLIDSSFEKTFGRTVQNTLSVPQVSREDLGAMLTCQASNNNISAPASSRVTIDLKCKYNNLYTNNQMSEFCPRNVDRFNVCMSTFENHVDTLFMSVCLLLK